MVRYLGDVDYERIPKRVSTKTPKQPIAERLSCALVGVGAVETTEPNSHGGKRNKTIVQAKPFPTKVVLDICELGVRRSVTVQTENAVGVLAFVAQWCKANAQHAQVIFSAQATGV